MTVKLVYVDENNNIVTPRSKNNLPPDLPKKAPKLPSGIIKVGGSGRSPTVKSGNGHWNFDMQLSIRCFGFIYLIKDVKTGKMYIGKKQFLGTGIANRGVETDWRTYKSSCKLLREVMAERPADFEFYVLEQYTIRGSLGYAETWSLMQVEALANPDKWYNGLVNKVSWVVRERITPKHKARLAAILAGEKLVGV